jgi:hypothetical protein
MVPVVGQVSHPSVVLGLECHVSLLWKSIIRGRAHAVDGSRAMFIATVRRLHGKDYGGTRGPR